MNIILVHTGCKIPQYFFTCVKQIRRYNDDCEIFVIIPENECENIFFLENKVKVFSELEFHTHEKIQEYKKTTFLSDFWSHAFIRLLYLEAIIEKLNLENSIHIENDVLLYHSIKDYQEEFKKEYHDRVAVTPLGEKYATFAYVYIDSISPLKKLNRALLDYLSKGFKYLDSLIQESGSVNEMLILKLILNSNPSYLSSLPILPEGQGNESFKIFNSIFDPASFGQYVGGTGIGNYGWTGSHHFIGRELAAKKYKIVWETNFEKRMPYLVNTNQKKIKINNLHIHSKELEKYI